MNQMYKINQLAPAAQIKASATVVRIIRGHRKVSYKLGLNMFQFELATKAIRFDLHGEIVGVDNTNN